MIDAKLSIRYVYIGQEERVWTSKVRLISHLIALSSSSKSLPLSLSRHIHGTNHIIYTQRPIVIAFDHHFTEPLRLFPLLIVIDGQCVTALALASASRPGVIVWI